MSAPMPDRSENGTLDPYGDFNPYWPEPFEDLYRESLSAADVVPPGERSEAPKQEDVR